MVSADSDCAEPECGRPHATPIKAPNIFRSGLLNPNLAKLTVSPFKASGAFKALRGRNPTRATRKKRSPAR